MSENWHIKIFNISILKQEKLRQITELMDNLKNKTCLDIGGDNGVISYLLRQRGGEWYSADLEDRAVESIQQLVGMNVFRIDDAYIPLPDNSLDLIVIVDFLEHIHEDRNFVIEMKRVLRPGGEVIINVPHIKSFSLLNRIRHAIGLTDEKHGHLRPGYTFSDLVDILGPNFIVKMWKTYSKSFSESIDISLNFLYEVLQKAKDRTERSKKGTLITQNDMVSYKKEFFFLSIIYPFLWVVSKLDRILFFQKGYKLILKAQLIK